jgi:hypothetical protein
MKQSRCGYCHKSFESPGQVSRHVAHSASCRQRWEKDVQNVPARVENDNQYHKKDLPEGIQVALEGVEVDLDREDLDDDNYVLPAPHAADMNIEVHIEGLAEGILETREVDEGADDSAGSAYRHTRWTEAFLGRVAEGYGRAETTFEDWRNKQMLTGASQWSPFKDKDEWELSQWLFKNAGQSAIDEYLKLPSVSYFLPLKENSSLTYRYIDTKAWSFLPEQI